MAASAPTTINVTHRSIHSNKDVLVDGAIQIGTTETAALALGGGTSTTALSLSLIHI